MRKSKTGYRRHIGAEIPDGLFQVMNLYCIAKGVSKTAVITDSLELWAKHANTDINDLASTIAGKFQDEWDWKKKELPKDKDAEVEFHLWTTQKKQLLLAEKMSGDLVDQILRKIMI